MEPGQVLGREQAADECHRGLQGLQGERLRPIAVRVGPHCHQPGLPGGDAAVAVAHPQDGAWARCLGETHRVAPSRPSSSSSTRTRSTRWGRFIHEFGLFALSTQPQNDSRSRLVQMVVDGGSTEFGRGKPGRRHGVCLHLRDRDGVHCASLSAWHESAAPSLVVPPPQQQQ